MTGEETLSRLRGIAASLPPAEVRIAELVLSDPRRVAALTISQLAAEAGTSQTSVLRFARRLDLSGYPELRLALAEAAGAGNGIRKLSDLSPDDTLDRIVAKVAVADAAAVEDTARRLDRDTLAQVAAAMRASRRVDLYGAAASSLVAADLQLKLHRIGLVSYAWSDSHLALTSASLMAPGDVAIAVSHSGTTVEAIEMLHAARQAGATTVAITNAQRSPVAKAADHVLLTAANETPLRSGATASRIAALVVVDTLFLATAQADLDGSLAAIRGTRQAVARHHRSR